MSDDTDAVLTIDPATGLYDMAIGPDGDILTADFFDTAILYSLLGERRASAYEVSEPQNRRGWIGNEGRDYENGSKLWLFYQARKTATNLSRIEDEAKKALQWLVDDDFAVAIEDVIAVPTTQGLSLDITIRRTDSRVDRRFFTLWQNTGTQ